MKVIKTVVFRDILRDSEELTKASDIIKSGGTVVFPTETVYGLGADANNGEAVNKIFVAKERPADNPLIVHIAEISDLGLAAADIPDAAFFLFEKFSPGPLTMILKKNNRISDLTTAGLSTVAVRIPSHNVARALIKACGVPLAAPSSNRSGRPSPTTFDTAFSEMNGRVNAVINGGDCEIGLESTVLLIDGKTIRIVRPGAVTEEMIKRSLEDLRGFSVAAYHKKERKPVSPGMKYLHYKPRAEVYLSADTDIEKIRSIFPEKKIGIILFGEGEMVKKGRNIFRFRTLADYARGLYRSFNELDKLGCDIIIAQPVEQTGLGKAIMNRLLMASGGKII